MRPRRTPAAPRRAAGAPFLHRVASLPDKIDPARYPFNVRAFSHGIDFEYRETKHFLITRDFLNSPDRFFKHLFETVEETGTE
jgi:hypothetical protein